MARHPQKGFLNCSLNGFSRLLPSSRIRQASAVALVLAASSFGGPVLAQPPPVQFEKYEDFMAKTRTAGQKTSWQDRTVRSRMKPRLKRCVLPRRS